MKPTYRSSFDKDYTINRDSSLTKLRTSEKSRRSTSGKDSVYVLSIRSNAGSEKSFTDLHATTDCKLIKL